MLRLITVGLSIASQDETLSVGRFVVAQQENALEKFPGRNLRNHTIPELLVQVRLKSTTHHKFDLTKVQTRDSQIMDSTFPDP